MLISITCIIYDPIYASCGKETCMIYFQDWWDPSIEAERQRDFPGPSPFKTGLTSPLRYLPSCSPSKILIDSAHSFHIKGFGVDWCASSIVLACRKGLWGGGSLDTKLERAYRNFQEYCVCYRKVTSCELWSKVKFDMATNTSFPSSIGGKGFDTAICCGWLEHHLSQKAWATHKFSK